MFANLRADFERARDDRPNMLSIGGYRSAVFANIRILFELTTWAVISYRCSHWAFTRVRLPIIRQILLFAAELLQRWTQLFNGVFIDGAAEIGPGLVVHTPYGICIGPATIGKNCTIGMGVVIDGRSGGIGDNVYFGPGAKVVGTAKVGSNVVVVSNSVVLTDVPDDHTVIGVPVRSRLPGGKPQKFLARRQVATASSASAARP